MIEMPPAEFDHPCDCVVIEQLASAQDVERRCGRDTMACEIVSPLFPTDKCFIVLPWVGRGGVANRTQDLLRRHEIGHCNGWRH